VVDLFKAGGKGHITRMQAVLRAYVDAQKRRHEATRDASIARSRCRAQRDLATARRRSTRDAGRRIHEALHG